jgi:hypothetical protein
VFQYSPRTSQTVKHRHLGRSYVLEQLRTCCSLEASKVLNQFSQLSMNKTSAPGAMVPSVLVENRGLGSAPPTLHRMANMLADHTRDERTARKPSSGTPRVILHCPAKLRHAPATTSDLDAVKLLGADGWVFHLYCGSGFRFWVHS